MKHTKRLLALLLTLVMLLSAMPMTALAADGVRTIDNVSTTELETAIANYKNAMDGTIYRYMQDAYDKYCYAVRVLDATKYGSLNNQSTINTAKNNLNTATATMTTNVWGTKTDNTGFKADGSSKFKYGNVTRQPSYSDSNNILWAYDNTTSSFNWSQGGKITYSRAGTYSAYFSYYYPTDIVLMYDSTSASSKPKIPIILGVQDRDSNYDLYPQWIYTNSNNFSMGDSYWRGYSDGFGWAQNYSSTNKLIGTGSSTAISHSHANCLDIDNTNTPRSMNNYLQYDGNPTETITTVNSFTWNSNHYTYNALKVWSQWEAYDNSSITSSTPIRIINYLKLKTAVANKKSAFQTYCSNVKNGKYVEGQLSNYFAKFDIATFNPNDYFSTTNNDYTGCGQAVDKGVTAMNSLPSVSEDTYQTKYQSLRNEESVVDGDKLAERECYKAGNTKWTTTSWNTFKSAFETSMDAFDDLITNNYKSIDSAIQTSLHTAYAGLKERADFREVDADKANNDYIIAKASNDYTTSTHNAFVNAYAAAETYADWDNDKKLNTEKAVEQDSIDAAHNNTIATFGALDLKADFTAIDADKNTQAYYGVSAEAYTYDTYKAFVTARHEIDTYAAYDAATRADTGRNAKQAALDQADADIRAAWSNLAPVDAASKYETFDAVVATVQGELTQTGKYSAAAIRNIETILAQKQAEVYHTVTADEADLLGVTTGTLLKNTTTDGTDTITAALLTAVNTITQNESNYNNYTVTFTAEKDGEEVINQTATVPYGTVYTFDLGSNFDENANTVVWSATTNDGSEVTGSNKMNGRGTIDKLIDTNIAVHAVITGYAASNLYTYKIYNGNGRLVAIEHHATNDVKEFNDAKALVAIPFYTFDSWYIEVDENTKTVTVKAAYAAGDPIHYTVFNGTLTDDKGNNKGTAADLIYDRETKVAYTGNNTFYAWAVKVGSKYTVVSYNNEYTFYSHTALDFVPIIKDGNTYKFETESGNFAVTAEQIASASENTFGLTADEYVKTKLDNKAPFIAVVGTKILNNEKTRAFAMVTEGCTTAYTGVGMKFDKGDNDPIDVAAKPIPTVVSTGQFSVTLSGTTSGKFRATVNYDFPYSQAGGTAHLDVTDVSDLA